jgi:hypothetical protein
MKSWMKLNQKVILFSHKFGQLGNRLFAFAHLIANAAANNTLVANLSFDEYAKYFDGTSQNTFCRYPRVISFPMSNRLRSILFFFNRAILKFLRRLRIFQSPLHIIIIADLPEYQFGDGRCYELNSNTFQEIVKEKPIVFLFGRFFRDYMNFEKYKDVIRSYFTPTKEIQDKVSKLLNAARKNSDLVIGVHIRRGDYALFDNGRYFYSQEQYARKITILQANLAQKKITYILCSNDIIDGKVFEDVKFIIADGQPIEDMYTLSQCDLIMGPPSTFSAWAAFHGDKPLYQIKDINKIITVQDFINLPPQVLYNF